MLPQLDAVAARESLRLNLVAYLEHVASSNVLAMAEYLQCPRSILQSWLDGAALPRLDSLLRICRSLNIPASSLFTHSYPTPMNIAAAKNAIALLGNRGASPSRHASEIRKALLLALREDEPRS
jgi:transcriptional regulator with XRE-family HTH domain